MDKRQEWKAASYMKAEAQRRENNRDRILSFLQQRGKAGATNKELNGICFRYGARIYDLRREGWEISTIGVYGGEFRFILKGRIQSQPSLFAEMTQ